MVNKAAKEVSFVSSFFSFCPLKIFFLRVGLHLNLRQCSLRSFPFSSDRGHIKRRYKSMALCVALNYKILVSICKVKTNDSTMKYESVGNIQIALINEIFFWAVSLFPSPLVTPVFSLCI